MSTVLTENIVLSRTRQHDLSRVKKLNCWGSGLSDVSIVERMPNVEVLSLSINDIKTLKEFASCKHLQELYLRKNKIADINEIFYIQDLPNLHKLLLSENPCVQHPKYRFTVIRALPNLEYLDNIPVTRDEIILAETQGDEICDPSQEARNPSAINGHQKQDNQTQPDDKSKNLPPSTYEEDYDTNEDYEEEDVELNRDENVQFRERTDTDKQANSTLPTAQSLSQTLPQSSRLKAQQPQRHTNSIPDANQDNNWRDSNQNSLREQNLASERHQKQASVPLNSSSSSSSSSMLRSQSVGDYTNCNNCSSVCYRSSDAKSDHSDHTHDSFQYNQENSGERYSPFLASNRRFGCQSIQSLTNSQSKALSKGGRNRNANILSAVLCLIKELDFASLEVVETAIHCRMEEMEEQA